MNETKWRPSYNHSNVTPPPATTLNGGSAGWAYKKLQGFLGIEIYASAPAEGWDPKNKHRDLFYANGFHHKVRWMPRLEFGWRRLTYQEFLSWYNIKH